MSTSKSDAQLLQEFVGSLLNDPGIEFDAPDIEITELHSELVEPILVLENDLETDKNIQSSTVKLSKTDIKITSSSETPLYSERIERAQNLLKAMPKVADANQYPEIIDLPQVLVSNDLINGIELENADDIVISEGAEEIDEIVETQKILPITQEEKTQPSDIIANFENVTSEQTNQIPSPLEQGIPEWGRGDFQSLIFNIGELKLAVPLVKLGGIHRIDPKPTPMPDKPNWYLGLVADSLGNISLIDTALWIMPEKYDSAKAKGLDYELIVLLDNSRWGLACSGVDTAITLSESDIQWNHKKSKRPWLAGMLVEEMCALVDVDTLLLMLDAETSKPQ